MPAPVTLVHPVIDAHLVLGGLRPSNASAPAAHGATLREILPTLAHCNVAGVVLVQAEPGLDAARQLLDAAHASEGMVRGVVVEVDLAAADAIPVLTRLAREPLVKALRLSIASDDDAARCRHPATERTLAALPRLGLRLDVLAPLAHLTEVAALAQRHPDLALVLGHAGMPPIATGDLAPWLASLRSLAASPRVRCKVSGLVTQAGAGWTIDKMRPGFDELHRLFGPQRLMWGSDWPRLEPAATYRSWHAATIALTSTWPVDDRGALMGGTARRFYGL